MRPVHPATKTALSRAIGVINEQIKVTALSLNGVNAYLSHQPIVAAGDFTRTVYFSMSQASNYPRIFGDDDDKLTLYVSSTSNKVLLKIKDGAGYIYTAGVDVVDRDIHCAKVRREGDGFTLTVDGVDLPTKSSAVGPLTFTHIGKAAVGSNFFDGQIFVDDFIDGFTDTAGNPLNPLYYPGKHKDLGYVPNERAPLGGELWLNPILGDQWADNGDGSYTLTGDGEFNTLRVPSITSVGDVVAVKFTVSGFSGAGSLKLQNSASEQLAVSADGDYKLLSVADGAQMSFARRNPGEVISCTISNISVKLAPGYALKNGTAPDGSDSQSYTKMADGRLLNDASVLSNGHFDTGVSDWTLGPNWSWSNGKAVGVNLNAPDQYLRQTNVLDVGQEYLVKYAGAMSSGEFGIRNQAGYRDSTDWLLTPSKPLVEFEWVADLHQFEMKRYATIGNIEVDWVSAQPILSYAPGANT